MQLSREDFGKIIRSRIDWNACLPDAADKLLNIVCRMESAPVEGCDRDEGDLFFMPTPIRRIEEVIVEEFITPEDHFIDIGCGPGARLPIYVNLRTGASAAGIDKYPAYIQHASDTVDELTLGDSIEISLCDALEYDYRRGSVLYLFRSVEGKKLRLLLDKILSDRAGAKTLFLAAGGVDGIIDEHPDFSLVRILEMSGIHVYQAGK